MTLFIDSSLDLILKLCRCTDSSGFVKYAATKAISRMMIPHLRKALNILKRINKTIKPITTITPVSMLRKQTARYMKTSDL